MPEAFPTQLIGSPSFLTTLINNVRQSASASPPLDPVIFQALLTCIIAGESNLIIRTPEEDVSLVSRLVVWTLTSVFDYPTHKLKIRRKSSSTGIPPPASHEYFLRSLFLPTSNSSSGSNYTSQDESSDANKPRRLSSRHSRSLKRPHTRPDTVSTSPAYLHVNPAEPSHAPTRSPTGHQVRSNATLATAYTETSHHHHSHNRNLTHSGNKSLPQLPRALIISGLENASVPSQRALAEVLAEKRVVFDTRRDGRTQHDSSDGIGRDNPDADGSYGMWNLPDGFIVVYVCPTDPRERPTIHTSLLDKFAMSCNVFLKPTVRHALQSSQFPIPHSISRTNSGPHSAPSSPLSSGLHSPLPPHTSPHATSTRLPQLQAHHRPHYTPHPFGHSHSHSHSGSSHLPLPTLSSPTVSPNFIEALRQACNQTHLSPTLTLYLADLFSGTRHHAQVDGTLLTARCVHDAERLARAARVLGADPTGMELMRGVDEEYSQDQDQEMDEEEESEEWQDVEDEYGIVLESSSSIRKSLSSSIGNYRSEGRADIRRRRASNENDAQEQGVPVLDVTEVNIARMFPRCVSHRLRVRDGPRDEVLAGAVFGATFGEPADSMAAGEVGDEGTAREMYGDAYDDRPTVKEILVSVMSEV
ncbi:hypothetical protein P691DRAFT_784146 [Macrolepiota fuliginosa MF-IS2]|uniref:Uncharacterized protein n=1 Tax=Macrolepiota fuliginosa MF-IS2 TaxID=1400762 RepID=A0A9P5XAB5_9AGAR|nr:hypothetical protein P691DRAFT_784146 [Macrolepiota fuliginosa MF-IS2]